MKKRIIVPIAGILFCLTLSGGIYAFLTDKADTVSNKFTVGNIETQIVESFPSGQKISKKSTSDQTISKTVRIKNVGNDPCYVRVTVGFNNEVFGASLTGINKTDWVKSDDDDYYYYKRILEPGATTSALFTGVKIPPLADKQLGKTESDALKIDVYEESVQVEHAGVYFMNYDAAWDFYTTFR